MTTAIRRTALLALATLAVAGCMSATLARHTTYGQELMDLQKARASGAIDDTEYARLRLRIFNEANGGGSSRYASSRDAASSATAAAH